MMKNIKDDIDREIKGFVEDIRTRYHLDDVSPLLFDGIKDFLERDGKRIRPIIYMLAYKGYTRRPDFQYSRLLRSSLSLELLHDFLLIHDDVIDKSDLRRGKPTLHKYFEAKCKTSDPAAGASLAIVAGDVVFAMAMDAFLAMDEKPYLKERALKYFVEYVALTGAGEFIDVTNGIKDLDKVKEEEVFFTYTMKTAKYTFEAPLVMGAILGGADDHEVKRLSRLGTLLGQAFQLQDDMLDLFSNEKEIGKPVGSDLLEGKKTLLVWQAYNKMDDKAKTAFKKLFEKEKKQKADVIKLKKMIKMSGAADYCLNKLWMFMGEAEQIALKLNMTEDARKDIYDMIRSFFSKSKALADAVQKFK